MQIKPISTSQYKYSQTNQYQSTPLKQLQLINNVDSFQKAYTPSFKSYNVDKNLFNILDQPESTLKTLAEIFHKASDNQIKEACKARHTNRIGYTSKNKVEQAYNKFMPHVNMVRAHAELVEQDITRLTELSAKGDSNFSKQQDRIAKLFFELLKIEQSGRKVPNCNGIFIYGDAPNTDKKEFVEWFKKNVPANFEEITYDNSEPFESIKQIVAKAEDAENIFKRTGKRTILHIQDMDKLLTDEESKESRRMIGRFKQFVEHCSERYHTTVLLTTDYPLDEFEDASIASHRFETQIMLKDGIKPKQKTELEELQKEKERLNKATTTLDKYFWWENDDIGSSDNSGEFVEGGQWGDFCDHWKYL